ncbi:hypothetical protein B0H21DRAFT_751874 [Amylocystis lapponica]|nr:hypothetical protein B0H21DRAFT_751874 [Amylocystis lapponica]
MSMLKPCVTPLFLCDAINDSRVLSLCSSQYVGLRNDPFTSPRLPQEITDKVIDLLGESYQRTALAACSLTCHAWLDRSRVHIHSSVRLDPCSNLDHLTQLYTSPLAEYVRSLSIDVCVDGEPAEHKWIDEIRPLLRQFTRIERLSLDALVWADLENETQQIFLTQYPLVSDLWLSTCDFWDPSEFLRLLQALPRLESVRMEGMVWEPEDCTDILRHNAPALRLRWLDVGDICTAPHVIAKWAGCHREVAIENIHFSWACDHPVDLGILLKKAGSSVQTLSLTMDDRIQRWTTYPAALCGSLDLSRNTELRSLRLFARLDTPNVCDPSGVFWLSNVLAQLSSPHLSEVSICVEVKVYHQLLRIDWRSIDMYLSSPTLAGLKRVEICVLRRCAFSGGQPLNPDVPRLIGEALPKLSARRVLDVMQQWT